MISKQKSVELAKKIVDHSKKKRATYEEKREQKIDTENYWCLFHAFFKKLNLNNRIQMNKGIMNRTSNTMRNMDSVLNK